MKQVLSIVLVIIGALIGAGFASGQEIYSFFYCYGIDGLLGLFVMSILIGILIHKSLKKICSCEIDSYEEFLGEYLKNKKIIKIISITINILLLVTFYIMIAGFGAYFEQEMGVAHLLGSLILVFLCFLVFMTNVKGVLKVSEFIMPILMISIVFIGFKAISAIDFNDVSIPVVKRGWLLSSILYCSYNMILVIPVLVSLRKLINKISNIKYISIISGIAVFLLSSIIFGILVNGDSNISRVELPIVYIIRTQMKGFHGLYAFVILASIFTTAISIGIGLLQNISKKRFSYPQLVLFLCITSLFFSNFGFSNLINFAYPIFGYLGIIQIILIFLK